MLRLLMEDESHDSLSQATSSGISRGVKQGSKRGSYKKSALETRMHILAAAERGEDWESIAAAHGVKKTTAYNWVRRDRASHLHRGGVRDKVKKIKHEHIESLVGWLNKCPQLTLKNLCERLQSTYGLTVSQQTIASHLDGRMMLTSISKKQLYQLKKKRLPTSSTTVLIPDNPHLPPSPPATKIPQKQIYTKVFREENLKKEEQCQENVFTDRQTINHISEMAGKPHEISAQNSICVVDESENVPHPIQFSTPELPMPVRQPKSIEKPQPQGKKIFILADHQRTVMSNLALLWKSGKLCDAGIGNGLSTVMVHKVVLSAVCPKLLSVFGTDMLSQRFLQINLPEEVSTEALNAFAEYMYNGILDLDTDILQQLKIIAKQLDMKEFEQLCDSQLPSPTPQQSTSTANVFGGSSQIQNDISMSPNTTTTPIQPVLSFPSISSKSLSTVRTQVINIKDKISKTELSLHKENKVNVYGPESEVVLIDTSVDSSSGGFVMVPSVKNEPMEHENDNYQEHNNEFYISTPVSIGSRTLTNSLNSKVASTTEFVLPFSDSIDSNVTTNVIHGTSSKLKSNVFESSLVSDLSPVSCIEEKMCSQSSPIRKDPSKQLNRTGSHEGVYPIELFTAGGDSLPLSSSQVTNVKNIGLYKTNDLT